jgi:hypothetical protein
MKNSMSLIFLLGLLALSPWKEGLAQTGSEEGSTDSAGMTGTESGTRSREILNLLAQQALRAALKSGEKQVLQIQQTLKAALEAEKTPKVWALKAEVVQVPAAYPDNKRQTSFLRA